MHGHRNLKREFAVQTYIQANQVQLSLMSKVSHGSFEYFNRLQTARVTFVTTIMLAKSTNCGKLAARDIGRGLKLVQVQNVCLFLQ